VTVAVGRGGGGGGVRWPRDPTRGLTAGPCPRARRASTYPSPWRPLQCVCRPWPERDVAALALGSLCMPGMRAGGGHALSAGAVVVAELRRRSPAGERWWDETAAAACAAADVNRDALLDAAEMVALCMGVGPAWTEARVLDLFRGCL